ncbi:MAG: hypothetical protein KGI54_10700 [Pseudomonadota bacterium]|nr:hypothetical protein [Pseudomonadota bacterium]
MRVPKSLRGVLLISPTEGAKRDFIKGIKPLEEMMGEHTTVAHSPEGVVSIAKESPDVTTRGVYEETASLFTKGFLFEKLKTNNPVVKYTYDRISQAVDAAKNISRVLLQEDLLPKLREMSMREFIDIHGAMMDAMKGGYELSRESLLKHGFSEKQVQTWESFQRSFTASFENINTALKAAGEPEISRYTAYMAGMATGDYRTAIVKKVEGKPPQFMGFIGSNVKWMNDIRVKRFLKEHPEYSRGEDTFHGGGGEGSSASAKALMQAIQLMREHNPDMARFHEEMVNHLTGDAYNYKGANKHTLDKKGVFGMEGDKQWITGVKDLLPLSESTRKAIIAKQNALEGFRAQVMYIEGMAQWSELSKASSDLKKVFADPELQEKQKNAIAMSKEYLSNALGNNTTAAGQGLHKIVNSMANGKGSALNAMFGVSPSNISSAIRFTKGGINTIFFGVSTTFLGANHLQGIFSAPAVVNLLRSRGFDVAAIDKAGTSNYMKATAEGLKQWQGKERTAYSDAKWAYGREHGISATQIFEHNLDVRKGATHAANVTLEYGSGSAESIPRSTMYSMIADVLKESGYEHHPDIFKVAREITDRFMVDYRPHEGQKINRAFGPFAPLVGNLSSFSAAATSNFAAIAKEAMKTKDGRVMMALFFSGLVAHGVMGFPGFSEADWMVETISSLRGKPTTLANEVLKLANSINKESKGVGDFLSVGFGHLLGLDLHQVMGRSSIMPPQLGAGGAGAAVKVAQAAGTAVAHPSEMNAKRLAYEMSPKLAKSWEDLTWFSDGNMAMNRKEGHATEGMYRRNEFDTRAKMAGATSLNEFKNKEQMRQLTNQELHYREAQKSVLSKLQDDAVSSGGLTPLKVSGAVDKYLNASGDPKVLIQELKKYGVNVSTTHMERLLINKAKAGNIAAARTLQRMQETQYGGQ